MLVATALILTTLVLRLHKFAIIHVNCLLKTWGTDVKSRSSIYSLCVLNSNGRCNDKHWVFSKRKMVNHKWKSETCSGYWYAFFLILNSKKMYSHPIWSQFGCVSCDCTAKLLMTVTTNTS